MWLPDFCSSTLLESSIYVPEDTRVVSLSTICIESDSCPLVIVKGSYLTPTKQDYDAGVAPLQKFVYTISELEWILESYGLKREDNQDNQEIRYIIFVDECDQIKQNSLEKEEVCSFLE